MALQAVGIPAEHLFSDAVLVATQIKSPCQV